MELSDVLVDLYLRSPAEFVPVRADRVRQARENGDADLARQISRLPKPSAGAWLVNLLAARKPADVGDIIELGAELRAAEENLAAEDLRRLGRQRLQLIRAVARRGQDLAAEAGHRMSAAAMSEVEQTLHAAMSDPSAAEAVQSGRLVRALRSNGIDPVDVDRAIAAPTVAVPRPNHPTLAPVIDDPAAGRRQAEAEERARKAAEKAAAAEEARTRIRAERTLLSERRLALETERGELAARLAGIDRDLAAAERDDVALRRAAASADRDAEVASRAAERASGRARALRESRTNT